MRIALPDRVALAVGATLLLLALGASWSPASAAVKKVPSATTSLKRLVAQTTALPRTSVSAARRARLLRLARHARSIAGRSPCRAVADLGSFRRSLALTTVKRTVKKAARNRAQSTLATLGSTSLTAARALLRSKKTGRCGGGVAPSNLAETKATVLASDANGMKLRVALAQVQLVPETGGGKTFTKLVAPNTDAPGTPGSPAIPASSHIFGVPDGAKVVVKVSNVKSQTFDGVQLYPVQPDPVDAGLNNTPVPNIFKPPFVNKSFVDEKRAPKGFTDGPTGRIVGQARDLTIGSLVVPLAQYDQATDKLKVPTSMDIDVAFEGGGHTFTGATGSPFETQQTRLAKALLNEPAVSRYKGPALTIAPCGEELLVITNASTRASANTFAAAKSAQGWLTNVVETGAGAGQIGTTVAQIQTYIRSRLNSVNNCVRPSYVTIVGDDELVPTYTAGPAGAPSDLLYAMKNNSDELPDVAIGRILGDGPTQLNDEIAKMIHYENSPPTGPMLTRALLAAQFQDTDGAGQSNDGKENRTFVQFAETVRSGLVKRGVAVDRVYNDVPSTTPKKFNDGTDLPAELKKPTFKWDGDRADISAAWNQGRFLVVHRDHGSADQWIDPNFTSDDAAALTNDNENLPVVLSVNCSSAAYDYDENGFTQTALAKPTGGAVGVFGDTRDSPTWHNSQLALGFVDALLPSVLVGEGPAAKQRTGDALISGKLRLVGLAPPSGPGISGGDADTRFELYAWHYFGDPTMQLWGGGTAPIVFNPNIFTAIYKTSPIPKPGDPPPFFVEVTLPGTLLAGQPVSLLRRGQVIGKAIAGDGSVQVPALFNDGTPPAPGDLAIAIEADGAAPVVIPVGGVPPQPTAMTQNCPATATVDLQVNQGTLGVSGTLKDVPAGSPVAVTFTGTNITTPRTAVVNTTTDASGNWAASIPTTRPDLGTWTVSSTYAGTSTHAPSSAGPCTILVQPA
jgi:hypothetical protein